jgi:hypothetical protein
MGRRCVKDLVNPPTELQPADIVPNEGHVVDVAFEQGLVDKVIDIHSLSSGKRAVINTTIKIATTKPTPRSFICAS